ncbi:hypothetical protein D8674_027356 [Pyrus ussuriensis x Pyrus communis]|uniref:Uncharacterized protein n=1 Tax=Pyrus ussuriensis x Pyrus communis TaxID=2448454 RepID=A0A5N5IEA3_9ROSA|nr:hypothetical protein D8674_027356 [Pyrus ussuriensis x Pyrus communis]
MVAQPIWRGFVPEDLDLAPSNGPRLEAIQAHFANGHSFIRWMMVSPWALHQTQAKSVAICHFAKSTRAGMKSLVTLHKHTFTFGGTFAFHSLDHSLFALYCVDEEASWVGGCSHRQARCDGNKSIFHRCVRGLMGSFTVLKVHPGGLGEKGRNDEGNGSQGSSQIRMVVPFPTYQRDPILSTIPAAHMLFQTYEELGCKGEADSTSYAAQFQPVYGIDVPPLMKLAPKADDMIKWAVELEEFKSLVAMD